MSDWRADARKVLAIAGGGLRRLFRDRSNIFFLLVFPILLVLVIGVVFGGDDEPTIGLVAPADDPLADRIVTALRDDDALDVHAYGSESGLRSAVEHGQVEAGVIVPAGFADDLRAGDPTSIGFLAGPSGVGLALQPVVDAAVRPQLVALQAARFAADQPGPGGQADGGGDLDAALARAEQVEATLPKVTVQVRSVGDEVFADNLGQFGVGATAELVLFMFVTGLASSAMLIRSRRLGVSRRMLSTPTPPGVVLVGETLARFTIVGFQGLYIVSATWLLFGVSWGDPVGALALVVLFALVATGAAMLAGSLFRNEQQASSAGVMLGLGLGAIGGCMVPLQIFPPTLRTIAHLTPHAWALDGFDELIGDNANVVAILPDLAVLAAMAVVLLALATWRLHRVTTAG
jgi:ABC-2 type transport system permease protein